MMLLLPDLYLLSGFPYCVHQNVYAIDSQEDNSLVLIDTGLDRTDLAVIKKNMHRFGLEGRVVKAVLLTHSHFDHAGNAAYFETAGSRIYIGEEDADAILTGDEHTLPYAYGVSFPVCQDVLPVHDGDVIEISDRYSITAHHTPGHTPGSMCYELKGADESVLFTGDFIQPAENPDTVRLGIKVDSAYSYEAYRQSALKMSNLKFDCILAGHYQPVLGKNNLIGAAYRELLVNRALYH